MKFLLIGLLITVETYANKLEPLQNRVQDVIRAGMIEMCKKKAKNNKPKMYYDLNLEFTCEIKSKKYQWGELVIPYLPTKDGYYWDFIEVYE